MRQLRAKVFSRNEYGRRIDIEKGSKFTIMHEAFILASLSPRRRELLGGLALNFIVVPSGIDESENEGESPRDHVLRLSFEKARVVAAEYPDTWVLGADTIVVVDGEILGKPEDTKHAKKMLRKLSGRTHRVITGFSLVKDREHVEIRDAVESTVSFKHLPEDEIEWYTRTDEPYDKAGAYAVQGKAAFFIKEIHGSYTNVIGLPLAEVVTVLKGAGVIRFEEV